MSQSAATPRLIPGYRFDTLADYVGKELGVGEWITVDQARIDGFADCTGDHQWIHVDAERARRESPFGATIAHGFLTLSLLARLQMDLGVIPPDAGRAINAGVDKVRFKTPVRAGSRVRVRVGLLSAQAKGEGRCLLVTFNELVVEGEREPAVSGELAAMVYKA
jgi:acyl dehydratase